MTRDNNRANRALAFERDTQLGTFVLSSFQYRLTDEDQNQLLHFKRKRNVIYHIVVLEGLENYEALTASKNNFEALLFIKKISSPEVPLGEGIKQPDEYYIFEEEKIIVVIEKKTQINVGSVAEKLQTGHFKKRQLELKCNGS